jgi:hypothetical protein
MTDGLSKKQLYELLKTLIATHDSVSMETDSFSHGQGASINLYLNEECVTRDYWTAPREYTDLAHLFFEYFQDTYEEGFESDHLISFHLDDNGDVFGERVDYASTNYFGDDLSIDPLVSEFVMDCEDLLNDLSEDQLSEFLDYTLTFNVSHSSQDELMISFKATKGRKKSPVALPVALHKIARAIEHNVIDCAESSFEILRGAYPRYEHSWTLVGDVVEMERYEYTLSVYKSVSTNDMLKIFENQI